MTEVKKILVGLGYIFFLPTVAGLLYLLTLYTPVTGFHILGTLFGVMLVISARLIGDSNDFKRDEKGW